MPLCDGVMTNCPECFEPEMAATLKAWLEATSRRSYMCGPLIPLSDNTKEMPTEQSVNFEEISRLLDSVLLSKGPQSLIYVSIHRKIMLRWTYRGWFVDVVRNFVLAQRAREGLGFSLCHHGDEDTIRKRSLKCPLAFKRIIRQVMSHASPFAVISAEVAQKVEAYEHGLLTPWSPQQTILRHEVSAIVELTRGSSHALTF